MAQNQENLEARVAELEKRLALRDENQIQIPLDPISIDVLKTAVPIPTQGNTAWGTQSKGVTGGGGGTVSGIPAQPSGTLRIVINGTPYYIPYK